MNKIIILLITTLICLTACKNKGRENCSEWGAHDYGNKITLLEGDKKEDAIMVYCTTSDGCCHSGIPIIPSKWDKSTKYIASAVSNDEWVLVKAVNKHDEFGYWLIDKKFKIDLDSCDIVECDSILLTHIIGPLDRKELTERLTNLKIDLDSD